jgi:Uncharacterized conserved protein
MTKLVYVATFEKDENTLLVLFPDVPGAITCGDDMAHAYEMAEECLGTMLEDEIDLPVPSTIEEIQAKYPNKAVALISVDMLAFKRKYHNKVVKKNTSIPEWLNELAEKENINFSQTLTEALKLKLGVK